MADTCKMFYATQGILCAQNSNNKQSATPLIVSMKKALHVYDFVTFICSARQVHILTLQTPGWWKSVHRYYGMQTELDAYV